MIPGHLPRRIPKRPQKSPFFNSRWPPPCNAIFKKQGCTLIPQKYIKKYFGVSTYVLRHKELIQMIRNNISTFLNTKNPRWPPYCSDYVKRSLKKTRKYEISISLLNLKCIFLAEPMESRTYLDDHILLYC